MWQVGLLEKMTGMGIDKYLIDWNRGFLFDGVSMLEVRGASLEVRPSCGVPQGSPASPILFLIYLNDLLYHLQKIHRVSRQAFTDDLLPWIVGDFCDGVVHPDLMRAMGMMERWSLEWRVHFNVMKCESMLFK